MDLPDGTRYPWVRDLAGVWHRRTPGDPWRAGWPAQAETLCGELIPSAEVAATEPPAHPDHGLQCCECLEAAADELLREAA